MKDDEQVLCESAPAVWLVFDHEKEHRSWWTIRRASQGGVGWPLMVTVVTSIRKSLRLG